MSNQITHGATGALPAQICTDLPRHLTREVGRAIDQESARGIVRAHAAQVDAFVSDSKIRAVALVARTAMTCSVGLSSDEEQCLRHAPLGERRYQLIADSFACFAANEIANLGRP
jgi:hypothetical protein